MDQDNELLRALIEKRQKMLARMREQIKTEHEDLDEKMAGLVAALENKDLLEGLSRELNRN